MAARARFNGDRGPPPQRRALSEPELLVAELVDASDAGWRSRRTRLAVSAAEYIQLREYLLARDGRFFGRIRNIPLVVDETPTDPPLIVEILDQAPDKQV